MACNECCFSCLGLRERGAGCDNRELRLGHSNHLFLQHDIQCGAGLLCQSHLPRRVQATQEEEEEAEYHRGTRWQEDHQPQSQGSRLPQKSGAVKTVFMYKHECRLLLVCPSENCSDACLCELSVCSVWSASNEVPAKLKFYRNSIFHFFRTGI